MWTISKSKSAALSGGRKRKNLEEI